MTVWLHDPDAVLDYTVDWTDWLTGVDTVSSAELTASTGLTVDSSTVDGTGPVTAVISTDGTTGNRTLACRITTTAGLVDERTMQINVTQR